MAGSSEAKLSPKVAGPVALPAHSAFAKELLGLFAARPTSSWLESSAGIESC